jgi:GNAT superfamily N-acetyltransferase
MAVRSAPARTVTVPSRTGAIRLLSATETHPIRLKVLRPGLPPESAVFDGDSDPGTLHLGAFLEGKLAGVASLFRAPFQEVPAPALQLRGMATLPGYRGHGCGRLLVEACYSAALNRSVRTLWCNARESALGFYSKLGWEIVGSRFEIPTVGPHFQMIWRL